MNFQDLRKNLKNPNEQLLFRELFTDYKKFQIKKIRTNKFDSDSKDYTKFQKTLSAVKLDNIIKKQLQNQVVSHEISNKFIIKKKLRAKQNQLVEKTFSHFFRNQDREKQSKKKCYFKDHFINENTLISESLKVSYDLTKQKSLGNLSTNCQKRGSWINKDNLINLKLKYFKQSNSPLKLESTQEKLKKSEQILNKKLNFNDNAQQNQLFGIHKNYNKFNDTHSNIFPVNSE